MLEGESDNCAPLTSVHLLPSGLREATISIVRYVFNYTLTSQAKDYLLRRKTAEVTLTWWVRCGMLQ